jgi:hypothetical protein
MRISVRQVANTRQHQGPDIPPSLTKAAKIWLFIAQTQSTDRTTNQPQYIHTYSAQFTWPVVLVKPRVDLLQ